ncbi:MAG: UvrD-helicase domain-containing protein [Thermodesulfobacteriota bacterium]
MNSSLVIAAIVSVVVCYKLIRHFHQKKKATKHANVFLSLFEETQKQVANLANGEYLNKAKVERYLSANQRDRLMDFDHSLADFDILDKPLKCEYTTARSVHEGNNFVDKYNEEFIQKRLAETEEFFNGRGLTDSQRLAVVRDEDANLINASAGSGKTRTILAKVSYLLEYGLAKPEEILIVAYNKKVQEEIIKKIKNTVHHSVPVYTLHAFGLQIMNEVKKQTPQEKPPIVSKLADDDVKRRFLLQKMRNILKDESKKSLLLRYFSIHRFEENPEKGISNYDDYLKNIQYAGLKSLDGQKLKSHQEVQIANWLILNGVNWKYEDLYPHIDSTYQPDFYLPDYDLWIEHFGIDEKGNTAPWIDAKEYNLEVEWKRDVHKENKTNLVETYSYESRQKGGLIEALKTKLSDYDVKREPLSEEMVDKLVREGFEPIPVFIRLLVQFLSLCRESNLSRENLRERAVSTRDMAFLELFDLLREMYEKNLEESNEIDYTDMIVRGTEYINKREWQSSFKYILVDEYQDITIARLRILMELQKQIEDARLFCVGDDWQSIYQFQGANIGLITHFEEHVGAMQRTDLAETFRFSQQLADFSRIFVTQNPTQLKKSIISTKDLIENARPVRIYYHEPNKQERSDALKDILNVVSNQSETGNHCLVLGRYNHKKPENWKDLENESKSQGVDIEFSTIHQSKGRETDWVIVLDNEFDIYGYGFPSGIQDDPVLRMVLEEEANFPDAEERRLFYVAVTRARKGVFLLTPSSKASTFILEIDERKANIKHYQYSPFIAIKERDYARKLFCPICDRPTIRRVFTKDSNLFYSCSHYPVCDGRLAVCGNEYCSEAIDLKAEQGDKHICVCGKESKICPRCGKGVLEEREGENGIFWGCSQYGVSGCRYTTNISDTSE